MMISRKRKLSVLAAIIGLFALEAGAELSTSLYSFVGTAEARIGRPLTPVSVAGVARRTVRRCAVGVYYC
ncbi:hypothetical protein J2X72_003441 [Phyllobacterium sp. 1468]|uniref:hypothetical protein n=1 Tax=Phyllobacterium sp. 1468 TaxID=2817759 RepID=UPI002861F6FB|nr:hypothetical protein [Phyllobacterium sp. 1468]MDR6634631.1 hypothetical protein [Phyllobacterium sp. 1468]